jgi:OOP family OmpA-OmpF porin
MKTTIKLAVALAALTSTPVFAQAYLGGSVGRVDHNQNRADWQPVGGTTSYQDIDTGIKIFGGYQFNQYFGVEGGYNHLGEYTATPTAGASVGKATVKVDSWSFFGVGTMPLPKGFSLFGKLGTSINYSKMDFSSNGGAFATSDSGSTWQTAFAWGVGGGYAFDKKLSVRIEYENLGKAGESNNGFTTATNTSDSKPKMISAGMVYKF